MITWKKYKKYKNVLPCWVIKIDKCIYIDKIYFQFFKDLIEQEIEHYEESLNEDDENGDGEERKKCVEVKRPGIVKMNDFYLFVSGKRQVFGLNSNPAFPGYVKQLSEEQIENLPEEILYSGEQEDFKVDECEAFSLLGSMISDMNEMQAGIHLALY